MAGDILRAQQDKILAPALVSKLQKEMQRDDQQQIKLRAINKHLEKRNSRS
jgi:hypothetical protein